MRLPSGDHCGREAVARGAASTTVEDLSPESAARRATPQAGERGADRREAGVYQARRPRVQAAHALAMLRLSRSRVGGHDLLGRGGQPGAIATWSCCSAVSRRDRAPVATGARIETNPRRSAACRDAPSNVPAVSANACSSRKEAPRRNRGAYAGSGSWGSSPCPAASRSPRSGGFFVAASRRPPPCRPPEA
jgi:hypothetical protein